MPSHRIPSIRRILQHAHRLSDDYLSSVDERPVFPTPRDVEALAALHTPLPESSTDAHEVLTELHRLGSPATVAQTGGRYFGFVNGGLLPVGHGARWLADTWDQNTAHYVMSPISSVLEDVCEAWLVDLLELPEGTAAGFVTGTMMANFTGLAAARNTLLERAGWDVRSKGLGGAPRLRVVVGEDAHAAIGKALSLLGLGTDICEVVDVDSQGRMRADLLPQMDARTIVCAQAGNVGSGAFDPFEAICDAAEAVGAWVHVDGAFGLWARACRSTRDLTLGLERASSWAVDAHKTLNVPYDCGIALIRERQSVLQALEAGGSYLIWSEQRDGMSYTPSMSKRSRGVELWATLRALGRQGVDELVVQLVGHARDAAEALRREGFEILNDVVFNQVLVSASSDDDTDAVLATVQGSGECWCGGTTWRGRRAIRLSVCSWATSDTDIERTVRCFAQALDRARRQ